MLSLNHSTYDIIETYYDNMLEYIEHKRILSDKPTNIYCVADMCNKEF